MDEILNLDGWRCRVLPMVMHHSSANKSPNGLQSSIFLFSKSSHLNNLIITGSYCTACFQQAELHFRAALKPLIVAFCTPTYSYKPLIGAPGCIIWTKPLCFTLSTEWLIVWRYLNQKENGLMNELIDCNRLLLQ